MKEIFPFLLITILACFGIMFLKGQSRPVASKPLDYDQYRARLEDPRFDPVGATKIFVLNSQERDGFDTWWRFEISQANLGVLVNEIANRYQGPEEIAWQAGNFPPEKWHTDSKVPIWWTEREYNPDGKSIHWCHPNLTDGRHHGWFVTYDPATSLARIWSWNRQWSANACDPSDSGER